MPTTVSKRLTSTKIKPFYPELAKKDSVRLPAGVNYSAGQLLESAGGTAADEVQTLTLSGTPTGGTFVLGYTSLLGGYDLTDAIAYNASAATVQTALEEVVGEGNVTVTGSAGGPWTLTYGGELSERDVAAPVLVTNSLTGGTSPTLAIATTTPGTSGAVGEMTAYSSGPALAVLEADTRTDFKGAIIDEFGSGNQYTAPVFTSGDFLVSDLVGTDSGAVTDLGKIINASAYSDTGAILRIT